MQHNNFFTLILLGLSVLVFTGCSNPDSRFTKVEGTVTYNGTAVEDALVTFMPVDASGEGASGTTDASGKYTLTSPGASQGGSGVLPAEYIVTISKVLRTESNVDPDEAAYRREEIDYDELQRRLSAKGGAAPSTYTTEDLLPVQYKSPVTTPFKASIPAGKVGPQNFDLED